MADIIIQIAAVLIFLAILFAVIRLVLGKTLVEHAMKARASA